MLQKARPNPAVDPVRFALWTLRDEAAQRRSPLRYVGQKLKRNASGKSQKQKLRAASFVIFSFLVRLVFTLYKECKD